MLRSRTQQQPLETPSPSTPDDEQVSSGYLVDQRPSRATGMQAANNLHIGKEISRRLQGPVEVVLRLPVQLGINPGHAEIIVNVGQRHPIGMNRDERDLPKACLGRRPRQGRSRATARIDPHHDRRHVGTAFPQPLLHHDHPPPDIA
jgi:hypothetical protein